MKPQTPIHVNKIPKIVLSDAERFPLISDLSFLNQLKQDEFAPKFNFKSGDRLSAIQFEKVKSYKQKFCTEKIFWEEGIKPIWMQNFVRKCIENVPFYKNKSRNLEDFPTISREDLRKNPHLFVPDDADLDELLVYYTSGSTGAKMDVLYDAFSQASWLPQIESFLETENIFIEKNPKKVAIAMICTQQHTLTYASLSTYLNGSGILKINLNQKDWKQTDDAKNYLQKYNPQILTGDPLSFLSLLDLKPKISPKAMISSAMKLSIGIKTKLENYFNCPVFDIYSLTECRNISFATENGHQAIRPDFYLEIFEEHCDKKITNGSRGELVVTGGNNPFLPLIRYRTGDFCSLKIIAGIPHLLGLEARNPIVFYNNSDLKINNIDISNALSDLPLGGFKMHQNIDKIIDFIGFSNEDILVKVQEILKKIFEDNVVFKIKIEKITQENASDKTKYSSEL